jgi:hypothetical protein
MSIKAFLANCGCDGDVCHCDTPDGYRLNFNSPAGTPGILSKEFPMSKNYVDVVATMSASERKSLAAALREVEMRGVHASAEDRRAAKQKRASEDPSMEPVVKFAVGQLRRLGLDLHAASKDASFQHTLDQKMKEARFDIQTRLATKSALSHVGIID